MNSAAGYAAVQGFQNSNYAIATQPGIAVDRFARETGCNLTLTPVALAATECQTVRRQPITPVHTFDVGRISAHIATLRLEHPSYGIGLPLTSEGSANE